MKLGIGIACASAAALLCSLHAQSASAAIFGAASPGGLDVAMGTPLLAVPADGSPVGTVYGHPPAAITGIPLPTPIGDMGFGPSTERLTLGTPTSSGLFLALSSVSSPIAGSTVFAPAGATAMDFFLDAVPGVVHTFEITAIGSATTSTFIASTTLVPIYVGFGAIGETLLEISIVKLPFPSPTTATWTYHEIRVLPTPGALALLGCAGLVAIRRKR